MEDGDSIDYAEVRGYVRSSLEGFLLDPPDSDYQRGYMAALKAVLKEAMGHPATDPLMIAITAIE
ncbi:MAG: hypothetical protein EOP83_05930 [Verrucomicrobiaceae bacterium]|nr:MAG: hypothetical protein EOP83_05930 [Verrucomicrobiaceae bacterium]